MPADDADIGVGLGGAKINESGNNDCDLLGRRLGNHALPVVARGGAEAGQFVPVEQRCASIQYRAVFTSSWMHRTASCPAREGV